jgi:acetylornithine deacetylase/succinyl-diaminopimelate desuccinylase-like protein
LCSVPLSKKQRQITIIIIVARLCSGLEQKDNNISLRHRQQMNPEKFALQPRNCGSTFDGDRQGKQHDNTTDRRPGAGVVRQRPFKSILASRVAIPSESQRNDRDDALTRYYNDVFIPAFQELGFKTEVIANPVNAARPFLLASREEDPTLPTVMCYGHGDVVFGDDARWAEGLSPWTLVERDGNWYGRGTADNKGQHSVNLAALEQVYHARNGRLGFNCVWLCEMGEEVSSPGLAAVCEQLKARINADLFIASDGPRLSAERPTLFLGSRGCANFRLTINARAKDYHSGNWGGLLSNPGTQLANAIASLVDGKGEIQIAALKPPALTPELKAILADITPARGENDPSPTRTGASRVCRRQKNCLAGIPWKCSLS